MADAWEWVAVLDDGSEVRERDGLGFGAVDRGRCVRLELTRSYMLGLGCQRLRVDVDLAKGQRAVFFRRRTILAKLAQGTSEPVGTLTVAGYESPAGGRYLVADDAGRVQETNERP